jgi:hypothetical protein
VESFSNGLKNFKIKSASFFQKLAKNCWFRSWCGYKRCWDVQLLHFRVGAVLDNSSSHRVCRVVSFSSSRRELGLPQPLTRRQACPPPRFWGEGHTCWRERGWESPNSDEGTYIVVLFIYIQIRTLWVLFLNNPTLLSYFA